MEVSKKEDERDEPIDLNNWARSLGNLIINELASLS